MKKLIDIVHIYAGTSGTAGLYQHEIYTALKDDFSQELFVSYNYSFDEGRKIYFKYSDLASTQKIRFKGKIRLVVRYFELGFSLLRIFLFLLFNNVKVINYSLFTNQKIELFFLKTVKGLFKTKIGITLHDIKPFATYGHIDNEINKKQLFIDMADYLIVHNKNSIEDLKELFKLKESRIIEYPFPIMDLNLLKKTSSNNLKFPNNNDIVFSFIGNIRKSKGLDLLINAFSNFHTNGGKANLIIAGNIPHTFKVDFNLLENKNNVVVIDRFLSDDEYIEIIERSDYLVLPYRYGTNSGIPSSAYSVHTNTIVSDIALFKNFSYINKDLLFKSENKEDLEKLIVEVSTSKIKGYESEQLKNKLLNYREDFLIKIVDSYKKMIQ